MSKLFPKARYIAVTLRESISADHNNRGGMLYDCGSGSGFFAPQDAEGNYLPCEIRDIVDRFGGGDSFCAGLLFATPYRGKESGTSVCFHDAPTS